MKNIMNFLDKSVTAYHAVENAAAMLVNNGYSELFENQTWKLEKGGKYFVRRGGSSIIAFKNRGEGFAIVASHSDFPAFAVKSVEGGAGILKLCVEKYGGSILYSWLDKPLGIAGRVMVSVKGGAESRLVDLGRAAAVIPSIAIHLRRDVNDGVKLSPAKDMLPIISTAGGVDLRSAVCKALSVKEEDILSSDLRLYCGERAEVTGVGGEFLLAPRIDNLISVILSLNAFVEAETENTPVFAVFDNEEVGSSTKQGANSTFLSDTLKRISSSEEDYMVRLAKSYMISLDNAHAKHPNAPELSDSDNNAPLLSGGVAVKYNANRAYATDALSDAIFRKICEKAEVKLQKFYNRADMIGGSTLGSISNTKVSIPTVDIGIPQLAMHSATEFCAISDIKEMQKALSAFYCATVKFNPQGFEVEY